MKLTRPAAAVSAAVLVFALAGCGSEDATPLTAAEFKEQADQICTDGQEEMGALEPAPDATSEERDEAFRKAADLLIGQAEKIRDLTPPEDIADDVEAMLDSLVEGAEVIKEEGAAALALPTNPMADAAEKANALGLESCGQ